MIPGLPPLVHLETVTLGSDASDVTLPASGTIAGHANFPAGSVHVVCIWTSRSTTATTGDQGTNVNVNGDTGSNYDMQRLDGTNTSSTVAGFMESGTTTWSNLAAHTGDNQDAGFFSPTSLLLPHAFGTDNFKGALSVNGIGEQRNRFGAGQWRSTAAITSVTITPSSDNWKAGSSFSLYVVDESYLVTSGAEILTGNSAFTNRSVPSQAGDICIIGYLRSTRSSTNDGVALDINGDTTHTNYDNHMVYAQNTTTVTQQNYWDQNQIGGSSGNTADTNRFSPLLATVNAFNPADNDPHVMCLSGHRSVSAADQWVSMMSMRRNNAEAVTSVNLSPTVSSTWLAGSGQWVYAVPKVLVSRYEVEDSVDGSYTFNLSGLSIPAAATDLRLNIYASKDAASACDINVVLNGDTTDANYDFCSTYGYHGITVPLAASSTGSRYFSGMPGSDDADTYGGGTVLLKDYASTSKHKHYLSMFGTAQHATINMSGRWENTAAITSIQLVPAAGNFAIGSIFELEAVGNAAPGWAGTFNGVDNPGKVNGIDKADIESLIGVASS